ncbi:Jerky -like protein-like [Trichinella patagoniensis]|uniref:Jerky-like protein-like n=1 Tax=Trichinella patagoniensis TaxID=990121 RepID=A0A0V1AA45_9BILA|nr:Jerky -like protein-like [Trichinella patagoniensis]
MCAQLKNCTEEVDFSKEADVKKDIWNESEAMLIGAICGYAIVGLAMVLSNSIFMLYFQRRNLYSNCFFIGILVGNMLTGIGYIYSALYRIYAYNFSNELLQPMECMLRNWQITLFIFGDHLCLICFLAASLQQYLATIDKHFSEKNYNIVYLFIVIFTTLNTATVWVVVAHRQMANLSPLCYGPSVISATMVRVTWGINACLGALNAFVYVKTSIKLRENVKKLTTIQTTVEKRNLAVLRRIHYYLAALFLLCIVPDLIICIWVDWLPSKHLFLLPGIARTLSLPISKAFRKSTDFPNTAVERGESLRKIAESFGVGLFTVSDIYRSRRQLTGFVSQMDTSSSCSSRKLMKKVSNSELDSAIYMWFLQKPSSGWLRNLKSRHGICELKIRGGKLSADSERAAKFKCTLNDLINKERYGLDFVYNADETGLIWKCLPKTSLQSRNKEMKTSMCLISQMKGRAIQKPIPASMSSSTGWSSRKNSALLS